MASDLSATQEQLAAFGCQLYRAVEALGGGVEVLSIVGSLGDTMPIDDLTGMLFYALQHRARTAYLCRYSRAPER